MSEIEKRPDVIEAARELDSQIRQLAHHAHVVLEALYALVEAARANDIHLALGFPSWTAYISDALDGQWKVERDKRGEAVKFLAAQGMSRRAIASVVGASAMTVSRDLAGVPLGEVMGLDGKTYTPPAPVPPVTPVHTITIPDTIEGARDRLEEIAAEEAQLTEALEKRAHSIGARLEQEGKKVEIVTCEDCDRQRRKHEAELAEIRKAPVSAERNAREFGAIHRYEQRRLRRSFANSGMSLEEYAEATGLGQWAIDTIVGDTKEPRP